MRYLPKLIVAALTSVAASTGASGAHRWDTYSNARYDYEICYPADLLKPQREADNGDGRVFVAPDGGKLLVFGANNPLGATLSQEATSQARNYIGRNGRITYRVSQPSWQVISGQNGSGTAFYTRMVKRDDQFIEFQLQYPSAASARYKPVIDRISSCFKVGKPAF